MAQRESLVVGEIQFAGNDNKGVNVKQVRKYTATVDPAACVTAIPTITAVTLTGVLASDIVLAVIPPVADSDKAFVVQAHVSAADTVQLKTFGTNTVNPISGTYTFIIGRFA